MGGWWFNPFYPGWQDGETVSIFLDLPKIFCNKSLTICPHWCQNIRGHTCQQRFALGVERCGGRCIWQIYNWTKIYIYSTFPKAKKSAREIWFWRFDENLWWREMQNLFRSARTKTPSDHFTTLWSKEIWISKLKKKRSRRNTR